VKDPMAFKRAHVVAGFEKCGLYPVNRAAISDDLLKYRRSDGDSDSDSGSDLDSNCDLKAMIADLDKLVHHQSPSTKVLKSLSGIVITKDIPLTQIKTPHQQPHGTSSPSPTQIPQFEFTYSRDNSPKKILSRSLMRSRSQSPENYYSSPEKNTRKRKLSRSRKSPQQSSQYRSSNSANPVTAHQISQLIRAEANVPTRTNRSNSDKRQKVSGVVNALHQMMLFRRCRTKRMKRRDWNVKRSQVK